MKQVFYFLILLLLPVLLFAQIPGKDSLVNKKDSLLLIESLKATTDTAAVIKLPVAIKPTKIMYDSVLIRAFSTNLLLNSKSTPLALVAKTKALTTINLFFYLLFGEVFILALLRFFYSRYFDNLFRVFFNTSLRQSQLTDQLLQAKQVSLFYNLLFVITGGIYVYLLLVHFKLLHTSDIKLGLGMCILGLAVIYFFKFLILKFTGWITGYKEVVNTYLFIIFLINKILSVLLLPLVIIMAFSSVGLQVAAVYISFFIIGLLFLFRFLRSYGLLQHQIKVGRFHFFMYIIGIELLPLMLIYKALMILLNKNI